MTTPARVPLRSLGEMTRGSSRDKIRRVLWTLLSAAAIGLLVLVGLVLLLWWKQESITWQPPRPPFPHVTARRVDYTASDGQPLYAYVVGGRDAAAARGPLLLVFHGNADLAGWQIPWAEQVARRTGWTVLAAEYRGYGGLSGAPTYEGSQRDARAAYAFARDSLGVPADQIAIFGHSLGSAVATELAAEVKPRALILQSPFTSARAMARVIVWRPVLLMWRVISRIHFDTERRVRTLETPLWVAHGDRDLIIPTRMGRAVFAAARNPRRLLIVRGAGHNDVEDVGGAEYWAWLGEALGSAGTEALRD